MAKKTKAKTVDNSLTGMAGSILTPNAFTPVINSTDTSYLNVRPTLIFNDRRLLSQLYAQYGLIQTFIDMPVDDAFRSEFEIKTDEAEEDDIEAVMDYMRTNKVIYGITQTIKMGRLFGGSGLVLMTNQDPETTFDIEKINKYTKIEFYPADMWELNMQYYNQNPTQQLDLKDPYRFYDINLNKSRVLRFQGKEAPSWLKPQMRGWGMTEVERVLRSFNQYVKCNNVIFELLDEAKIDIYKIKGLNSALMTPQGTNAITKRVQVSNELKNYLNSITMDVDDEFIQKTMNFSGLSDMKKENRMDIASDLKIPMTKLFGISSAGFNSGEDDIENYNSMIEHEVRAKAMPLVLESVKICFAIVHGYVPEKVEIVFPTLRMLSADQEQAVKTAKFDRLSRALEMGAISTAEFQEACNKEGLLEITIEETGELEDNGLTDFQGEAGLQTPDVTVEKKQTATKTEPKQAGNV